jgi:lysine-N-methylase
MASPAHALAVQRIAPRYMTRFRCIGSECESTCCAGWGITLDEAHYKKLRKALVDGREKRDDFDAKVQRLHGPQKTPTRHALMVLRDDGTCHMLSPDKLCSLQTRFGEEILPDTCAMYPRWITRHGRQLELTGVTSCPEVARQLLLAEDALELEAADPSAFARSNVVHRELPEVTMPYPRLHRAVRDVVLVLLSVRGLSAADRLFLVAYFGHRTAPYFHQGAREPLDARFGAEANRIADPALQRELARRRADLPTENDLAVGLAVHLLAHRASPVKNDSFNQLVTEAVQRLGEGTDAQDGAPLEPGRLLDAYAVSKRRWEQAHGPRLDLYFTNLAKNYWLREPYTASRDLLVHTHTLLVRLAVLRFLLFGHPLLAGAEADADAPERLDRAVVDVVHKFSRRFEHDQAFLSTLRERLGERGMQTLAHAACLIAF